MSARQGSSSDHAPITLTLEIRTADPPAGVLYRIGATEGIEFYGWVALMAAITQACDEGRLDSGGT